MSSEDRTAAHRRALLREHLTDVEWELFELRNQGFSWTEIAERRGSSPDAVRKQFDRAKQRVQHLFPQPSDGDEPGCNLCGPHPWQ